jgi:P4 family phage/plasmid primase-like protien
VDLWIKRDDLTGFELSGNKVRKLEFSMAAALEQGANAVVTCGGVNSNHCRATTYLARRLGLDVHLFLRTPDGQPSHVIQGNTLLNRIAGAQIHWINPATYLKRDELMHEFAQQQARHGDRFFVIPEGASDALGAFGFVRAAEELQQQLQAMDLDITHVVSAVGSGGTVAGLSAGRDALEAGWQILGFAVCDDEQYFHGIVSSIREELQPHRKSTLATVCLPVTYDPEAKCFRFRRFLEEIFEGQDQIPERIKLIQQMMGYTLLRDCRFEKMIFLLGGGSNGKSVLMHVITELLGSENVAAVQPKQYGNRFQRAHLEGKLANIVTEIGKGDLLPDDETKAMVTGEIMTVENKNQHPREIVPFATLWHATNHLPVLKDYSYAMIRRTFILQLRRNFDECPEIKDENLKTWLVETELPGILNFALDGLSSLYTDGWVEVDECRRDVEAWVKSGDTVACFLEDECDREPNSWTTTKDLYARYEHWCDLHGMTKVGGKQFTTQLQTEGFTPHRTADARGWKGVSLKPMKQRTALHGIG